MKGLETIPLQCQNFSGQSSGRHRYIEVEKYTRW